MSLKLLYFPIRGLAEAIRLMLWDNGVEFEEINPIKGGREEWMEWKPKMPFGQCPCLYDGDFQLVQSNAILRYLARKLVDKALYGSNDKEAATLDMINDAVQDLRTGYLKVIYQNYEEGKEPYIKELYNKLAHFEVMGDIIHRIIDTIFGVLTEGKCHLSPSLKLFNQCSRGEVAEVAKLLLDVGKNMQEGKYIVGDQVGFADYNLFEALDIHLILAPGCLDEFPKLKAYHAKMLQRPGIQKRHQSEGFSKIDVNGNGKQ